MPMFKRLKEIEERFDELTNEISKPEIASNPNVYKKFARERAGLEETVNTWRRFQEVEKQINDHKELINSKDKELADIAKEELPALEDELSKLESELKKLLIP